MRRGGSQHAFLLSLSSDLFLVLCAWTTLATRPASLEISLNIATGVRPSPPRIIKQAINPNMFSPSPSLIGPEYFYDAEKQANRPIGSSRPSSHTETHIKLAPSKSIVLHIAHHVQSFSKKFGTFISLVVFILVTYILLSHPNISTPPLSNYRIKTGSSTEAYVTLVSDIETNPWPAIQAQLLLFQTLHDPLTSDPSRDFVVLVTPDVSDEYVQELQVQGAIVIRILPLTRSRLSDTGPSVEEDLTKLRVFGLTQYDRVLFIDPTFVLAKSLEGIWESPAARSRYGLASNSINERMHDNPPDGRGEFFNDGFWMAKPSEQLYKEMLQEVEKGFVGGEPVSVTRRLRVELNM